MKSPTGKQCYRCKMKFSGRAYTCEFCNINFRRVCVELPPKIRHNLHVLHPLEFFKVMVPDEYYKCDGCATISCDEACYQCEECKFVLDIKCATIKDKRQILEERESNSIISHFSHYHKLIFADCPEDIFRRCPVCPLYISGPAYCCPECGIFIRGSCSKIERVMRQNSFHSQHPPLCGLTPILHLDAEPVT